MIYTISPDLLKNIEEDEQIYFTDILFVISQRANPFKIAIDKNNSIIKDYSSIKNHNTHLIKNWLDLMSFKPSPFEKINVILDDIDDKEDKYFKLCKETAGYNNIIYYSKQNIEKYEIVDGEIVIFEEKPIRILDKDTAKMELNKNGDCHQTFISSQVAQDHSTISKSKNE